MKVLLGLTVLVAFCQVFASGTTSKREKLIHQRLQSLIKQLRDLTEEGAKEESLFERAKGEDNNKGKSSNSGKGNNNGNGKNKGKAKGHAEQNIKDIDNETLGPKSNNLELFDSMIVLKDRKKIKPKDLPIQESPFVKALKDEPIKLTNEQEVELGLKSESIEEKRGKGIFRRGFTSRGLWEKGIVPYVIDESLNDTDALSVINSAIEVYNELTCVRWMPRSESQTLVSHQTFVRIYSGSGCWSYIGRAFNGEQLMSIKSPGCLSVGIALHEMLHALGQFHEQSRTDRDQHVYISESKLENGNYGKSNTRDYNPYDYQSVMHYSFSNGFEPLQPELRFLGSYGSGFTFYDVADITDAYRCTDHCIDPPKCKNGAFLNHRCECYCPYGLTGTTCDEVINADVCGGIIDLSPGDDVTITSPNYPKNYDVDKICVWLLRAPPTKHVKIHSDVFHLPYNTVDNRCYHWLEVRYNLVGQQGVRVCGDSSGDEWITSSWGEKNIMMLIMDSEFGKLHSPELGFSLRASTANDGCIPNPCVYGECKDCGNQDYKCECDPGIDGRNCNQIMGASAVTCTFEKSSRCFLMNVGNDDFDWNIYSGPTRSDYTGPVKAYSGENYMYAEASAPRLEGDKAILQSDLTFPADDRCLSFFYNMHGAGIGSLAVISGNDTIWSKDGDQGFGWRWAQINLPSTSNLQIKLEATRGSDWEGDIGIDDIELSPGLCENLAEASECFTDAIGKEYRGQINYTKGGLPCQRWDSNSPTFHYYHEYDSEENYCRNIRGDEPAPWCYTTYEGIRWDFCDIPHCEVEMCSRSKNGYDYIGEKDVTIQGEECKDNTKCRSSGNDARPWCYTNNPLLEWDACIVPQCLTTPHQCKHTKKGVEYFGSINVTESGKTCQRWDKQSPIIHKYWYLDDQENYCRNPDNSARPWCYPDDPNASGKEYCNIPYCEELGCSSNPCLFGSTCENTDNGGHICLCISGYTGSNCATRIQDNQNPEDCRRSVIGYEYNGQINITISGRTCQEWALDTPHAHGFNSLPENYCRNPDKEPAPWCYTTDYSKRWEICEVPFCSSPARECLVTANGLEYFGSVRRTRGGLQCQRWADQIPHVHSYGYISDQDDYCRNPYGHEPLPWCYTTDPDIRWDFCDIPSC